MKQELLHLDWVTKSFEQMEILKYVNLNVFCGEIFAVIGQNAVGKSTLLKIIGGYLVPDSGTIYYHEKRISLRRHLDALALGIYFVPASIHIIPDMTVFENVYLGLLETRGSGFLYHKKNAYLKVKEMIDSLGLPLSPTDMGHQLTALEKYYIEILRACLNHAQLLLIDEPFINLNATETSFLKQLMQQLKKKQISIIFTSHKISDIQELADRICLLKQGKTSIILENNIPYDQMKHTLIHLLSSPTTSQSSSTVCPRHHPIREVLRIEHYNIFPGIRDLSFTLYDQEILGITGLESQLLTQLLDALWGLYPHQHGNCYLDGQPISLTTPRQALKHRIAYMSDTESDHPQIIHSLSVLKNFTLPYLSRMFPGLWIRPNVEAYLARTYKSLLPDREETWKHAASNLSYGVQKKLALARWFSNKNRILILNEPLKGLDLDSRQRVIKHLQNLVKEGTSVIIKSVDFDDIIACASRVLVLANGKIQGVLEQDEITTGNMLTLALQSSERGGI